MRSSYVRELPWSGRRSSTAARARSALLLPAPHAPAAAAAPSGTGGTAAGTTWPRPPGPARSGDGDQKLANVVATETFFHGGKVELPLSWPVMGKTLFLRCIQWNVPCENNVLLHMFLFSR